MSTPSSSLRPISSISTSCSSGSIASRENSPWPVASTRSSQLRGMRTVLVAKRLAVERQAAMGAGPDAGIIAGPPIDEIMTASLALGRVVGDLVGRKAGACEFFPGELEHVRLQVILGQDQVALSMQREKPRARLDGELIDAEMAARVIERSFQLVGPCGRRSDPGERR